MFLGYRSQYLVLKDVILTLGKLRPRLNLDIVCVQKFLRFDLLTEGMCLDLIYRRNYFIVND